jgi:dihydrofolate reductase
MRRAIYYFTMSLDGFIADAQSSTAWLAGAPDTDYGYKEFYESIDPVLLGRRTSEQMLDMGDFFPYADKEVIVFTSNPNLKRASDSVRIETGDAAKTLARLELTDGGNIWIGGGAQLAGSLYSAGLIDEIRAFIQPILLGGGLPFLAGDNLGQRPLEWTHSKNWPGGITELRYTIPKRWRSDV